MCVYILVYGIACKSSTGDGRLTLVWIAPLNGMIRIKQARWVEQNFGGKMAFCNGVNVAVRPRLGD